MDTLGASPPPGGLAPSDTSRCVFCREQIHPSASVCPHCRSNLVPLQRLSDEQAVLEERIAVLEQSLAALQTATYTDPDHRSSAIAASAEPVATLQSEIKWPHMADNILLGLAALVTAHWLATTLPVSSRAVFRLVALIVALPFGYRFELYARSGVIGQVVAALAFGSFGTVAIGLLDMAVGSVTPLPLSAEDIIATFAAIALSHFAGSSLARLRRVRADQAASDAAARSSGMLPHLEAARIKTTAETVKALYEAAAPLVAGAAALWAACSHLFF